MRFRDMSLNMNMYMRFFMSRLKTLRNLNPTNTILIFFQKEPIFIKLDELEELEGINYAWNMIYLQFHTSAETVYCSG